MCHTHFQLCLIKDKNTFTVENKVFLKDVLYQTVH